MLSLAMEWTFLWADCLTHLASPALASGMDELRCNVCSGTNDQFSIACSTNTACSSSLVATHLANAALVHCESHAAASCGVFMVLLPGTMAGISQLKVQ